jgi:hypothetical protein
MSLSQADDKENLRVPTITIPAPNMSRRTQAQADWVPCTPATLSTPAPASRKKATWKPTDDQTLLECLRQQQAAGHQSDTGFKPVAWTACALALKDSEKRSGGGKMQVVFYNSLKHCVGTMLKSFSYITSCTTSSA